MTIIVTDLPWWGSALHSRRIKDLRDHCSCWSSSSYLRLLANWRLKRVGKDSFATIKRFGLTHSTWGWPERASMRCASMLQRHSKEKRAKRSNGLWSSEDGCSSWEKQQLCSKKKGNSWQMLQSSDSCLCKGKRWKHGREKSIEIKRKKSRDDSQLLCITRVLLTKLSLHSAWISISKCRSETSRQKA